MIKLNTNSRNKPFLLKPAGKDYLWGGNRLNTEFAKDVDLSPLAETWECSTHPDGLSYIASGEYTGISLAEVLNMHPEYLGRYIESDNLPILVKFIDANQKLSVQVHPDDAYAKTHENGQRGKTEMWYVLDAAKDAYLYYGLYSTVEKEVLRNSLSNGSTEKYLQKVNIKAGDVFLIKPGTIHAIGAGALIAEIQECSNLTYRLYDYDRIDKNGEKRELHIEKGLDVANLEAFPEPRQPLRVLKYKPGVASELLVRCKYFEIYRMIINTERRQTVYYQSDEVSYRVLLGISGCGTISFAGETLNVYKGDCVFVPANSDRITLHGSMQFLDIRG